MKQMLKTIKKLNLFLLITNLFFLQAYLIRLKFGAYPSNLQEVLIGANIITTAILMIRNYKKIRLKDMYIPAIFTLLTIISIAANYLIGHEIISRIDFLRHLKFIFFAVALTVIFLQTLKKSEVRKQGVRILGYGALTFGIFSAIYNLTGNNITHDYRLLGPLDSAVYLAFYLTPFLIFFSIECLEHKRLKDLIIALIMAVLLIATRSMGAIAGSFIVLIWYAMRRNTIHILQKKAVKISIGIIAVIIATAIFYTKIIPTITSPWSSLNERGEIWQTAIHILKEPTNIVTGVGLSQFEAHYQQNVETVIGRPALDLHVIQPHNIFFLFIFHYGILGIVFLLYLISRAIRVSWDTQAPYLNKTASIIMLYFIIHGLIDTPIYKNDILFLFILFASLLIISHNNLTKTEKMIN